MSASLHDAPARMRALIITFSRGSRGFKTGSSLAAIFQQLEGFRPRTVMKQGPSPRD
jgi:hypothetical protein